MSSSSKTEVFNSAVREHSGAMLHYLFSLSNDWQIAEDLSQDLWKAVHRGFTEHAMQQKSLLYRKAKQVFIDYYRKMKCRLELDYTDQLPEPVVMPTRVEPETAEEDIELYLRFWEIFYPDKYDETSKRIFWLHERYGYNMEEVGEIIGIPKSTAHDKLKKLRIACKNRLKLNNEQEANHHV